jgi:hypothetical protein
VSFDPLAPYGPVIESTVRVLTWNVWGRFGVRPAGEQQISGHYGVVADLRY